jgi:hypothetical protein
MQAFGAKAVPEPSDPGPRAPQINDLASQVHVLGHRHLRVAVSGCSSTSDYGVALSRAIADHQQHTKTQSYMVTIGVSDADGTRIGEINAISNSLAAGQSVNLHEMNATGSVTEGAKPGSAACVVASVHRCLD